MQQTEKVALKLNTMQLGTPSGNHMFNCRSSVVTYEAHNAIHDGNVLQKVCNIWKNKSEWIAALSVSLIVSSLFCMTNNE